MKFSIIVPVYNVEKYLEKCLNSVVAQTFTDYEVIVVDDETPDNSMEIVNRFLDHYPDKFRVIHQKNRGLGGARNTGVREAKGEYLLFLDSDDYIRADALEIIDKRLSQTEADVLAFDFLEVAESGEVLITHNLCGLPEGSYSFEEDNSYLLLSPEAWNKVYRRAFYLGANVSFPEKTLYEDVVTWILLAKAQHVELCSEHLYYYVHRSGSIMRSNISERMLDIIKVVELVRQALVDEQKYDACRYPMEAALLRSLISIFSKINISDYNSSLQIPITEYINKHFSEFSENPYILPKTKEMLKCICAKQYKKCYYRHVLIRDIKAKLLKNSMVFALYTLIKKRRSPERQLTC